MALVRCEGCGRDVSNKARACPGCGRSRVDPSRTTGAPPRGTNNSKAALVALCTATLGALGVAAFVVFRSSDGRTTIQSGEPLAAKPSEPKNEQSFRCSIDALKCDQFSDQGRHGMKLHELVYAARLAGRNAETVCLAQRSIENPDNWLQGAGHFESSTAWEALGCHDLAVAEVEASLATRPRGRSGWDTTCDWCRSIHGRCGPCDRP
jgi:hypothetical protein